MSITLDAPQKLQHHFHLLFSDGMNTMATKVPLLAEVTDRTGVSSRTGWSYIFNSFRVFEIWYEI